MQLSNTLHKKVQIQNQTKNVVFYPQIQNNGDSGSSELGSIER